MNPESGTLSMLALGAGLLGLACADETPGVSALPDSLYVDVIARLELIGNQATDPERQAIADSIRSAVLSEYGVDAAALLTFADEVGEQPARMRAVWEAIGDTRDSLQQAGWGDPRLIGAPAGGEDAPTPTDSVGRSAGPGNGPAGVRPDSARVTDTARAKPKLSPGQPIPRP
jgi:hypothetical protein